MFRAIARRGFFERRWVRYALALVLSATTVLAGLLLADILRQPPEERDVPLASTVVVVLVLAAVSFFQLYKAYIEARAHLSFVKLQAEDILKSLSIGVITTDMTGAITNFNERATQLIGVSSVGLGKPYTEVLSEVPEVSRHLDRMVVKGEEFYGSDIDLSRDGASISLRLDGQFMFNEKSARIGAILQLQDVSRLKRMDLEVRRTEKLAGLGTLAAGIAHEIRNPLSALQIHAQLLEEAIGDKAGDEGTTKYLEVIQSEIRRLKDTVTKYVSFAKPGPLEKTLVTLESIVERVLSLVDPECRERKIEVKREGFSDSPESYRLDEGQVQQALLNIVLNAIQAMPQGGKLTCRLGREAGFLQVSISDLGGGIPPEVQAHMFDLFYTTRKGGTGLGLYVAHRVVSEHEGYINVDSTSQGTTFTVGLRAEKAA